MGDRVSIQFVQEVKGWNKKDKPHTDKSVVLFHHWGGEWLYLGFGSFVNK